MYWAKSHFEIWKQEFMKSTFPAGWNYFILFSNPIRRSAAANLFLDLALWRTFKKLIRTWISSIILCNSQWTVQTSIGLSLESKTVTDPNAPARLDIGSCGLLIIHDAHGTGQSKTLWDIDKNMSSSYSLFKKSPARRSNHLCVNEKNDRLPHTVTASCFPMKSCAHR